MAGLKGIVEARHVWLTSIFHMNDPSELVHGIEVALEYLAASKGINVLAARRSFCDGMSRVLIEGFGKLFGFFVGSFSQSANDLAQWCSYADDGRGVSIAIAPEWFGPSTGKPLKPEDAYFVSPVVYEPKAAQARFHEAIDKALEVLDVAHGARLLTDADDRSRFERGLGIGLAFPLLWSALTTKHPAYQHESETRLVLVNPIENIGPITRTRTRGSDIVSYVPIELPLHTDILKQVVIGPAASEHTELGVENLLRANGINPRGLVSRSTIPYRSQA